MPRIEKGVIRPLKVSEIHHAHRWAVEEGWNPGPSDAFAIEAADPGALLTMDIDGEPAGVISAVRINEELGFAGFFVLPPRFRRSLCGWALMQATLERMGDRVIGADGLPERVHNYAHYGLTTHHHTITYHGLAPRQSPPWHPRIELAARTPLAELVAYDAEGFGAPRTAFLREWLALPGSRALVLKQDGRIRGLGAARRCHRGVRIGPLQADDPETAEALFDALVSLAPGEPLSIDCPDTNPCAEQLALKKKMTRSVLTARLYRGAPPRGVPRRVYGIMSFALG